MHENFNSYLNQEGEPVDFEEKRFQFWFETVPKDLRRVEYDLWKKYRTLLHIRKYQAEHSTRHGRFRVVPEYTNEQEKIDWKEFANTFLTGESRKSRFREIVQNTQKDIPDILDMCKHVVPVERISLVAITGSCVFGPRAKDASLSDVDVRLLINDPTYVPKLGLSGNEINLALRKFGTPYHVVDTGISDASRGSFSDVHWLLQPHYPIRNMLEPAQLRAVLSSLVTETQSKIDVLRERVLELNQQIENYRQGGALG